MANISTSPDSRRPFAAGYKSIFWIVTGLAGVAAIASGLSRFAYGLVLPEMQSALDWSYTTAGVINTASAVGYLVGAVLAAPLTARFGEQRVVIVGAAMTVGTVFAVAVSENVIFIGALRILGGGTAAASFIAGAAVIARLVDGTSSRWKTLMFGIYFGVGGGIGMVIPGAVLPPVLNHSTWQLAWVALGILSLEALAVSFLAMRAVPEVAKSIPQRERSRVKWPASSIAPLLVAYGFFGAGYIVYMTFIVALLEEQGMSQGNISIFWVVMGCGAIVGGYIWSPVLGRLNGGYGPAVTLVTVTAGAVLPLISQAVVASYLSAALFGLSFLATVTAIISCAQQIIEPRYWTNAIAGLTVLFSLGQCIGPVLSGFVSDAAQGIQIGFVVGAVFLIASILTVLFQRGGKRIGRTDKSHAKAT